MKEYYVPMDKDQKGLRGKVLSELLRNIDDSIDVSEKEDEKVMDKLSKLIDKLSIQNAHELSENITVFRILINQVLPRSSADRQPPAGGL